MMYTCDMDLTLPEYEMGILVIYKICVEHEI